MPTPPAPPDAIREPAPLGGTDETVGAAIDLEAERLRFREILECMPDHVLLLDRDGRIAYVNPALSRDLGVPAETLTGRPLEELEGTAPEFEPVRRELYRVLEVGEPLAGERTATGPTGARTYSYTMTPLTGPDGRVTAVMLTSRDVTPLTEAQTALAESEAKYRHLVELGAGRDPDPPGRGDRLRKPGGRRPPRRRRP